jgi:hypothetical protein
MKDTLLIKNKAVLNGIIDYSNLNNWELYFLLIATLTLIAAVVIPFIHKKNDEFRTKRSFKMYFKNRIGFILNYLTSEKIEYQEFSINKKITKEKIELSEFLKRYENDFKHQKDAIEPVIIYTLLTNLQNFLLFSYRLKNIIKDIDFEDLMKLTLEHGNKLSEKELSNIYQLITVFDSFISICLYHDRFGKMKSIKRVTQEGVWIELDLDKDFLEKQELLNNDLLFINEHETSIAEIAFVLQSVNQKTMEYFDYEKNIIK